MGLNLISKEECLELIQEHYDEEEIEVIFAYYDGHPIEVTYRESDGMAIPRWVQTIDYKDDIELNPNTIGRKRAMGEMSLKDYMDYNRKIGYSIYGFWEVFCFNDRFDWDEYERDMIPIRAKERENKIDSLID